MDLQNMRRQSRISSLRKEQPIDMKEKTYVEDIDSNKSDFKDDEKDA